MCGYTADPEDGRKCFVFFVCFCTVTDFFGQNKARGVKFCRVVQGRPGQGISHFWGTLLPRIPKSDQSATTRKYCLGCISLTHRKRHTTDAPFVEYLTTCGRRSACADIQPSQKTDVLVKRYEWMKQATLSDMKIYHSRLLLSQSHSQECWLDNMKVLLQTTSNKKAKLNKNRKELYPEYESPHGTYHS